MSIVEDLRFESVDETKVIAIGIKVTFLLLVVVHLLLLQSLI